MLAIQTETLKRYAESSWNGVAQMVHPTTHLPGNHMDTRGETGPEVRYYFSPIDAGAYLTAVLDAARLGIISEEEGRTRLDNTLNSLTELPRQYGLFHQWYYSDRKEVQDSLVSAVENAYLAIALMAVSRTEGGLATSRAWSLLAEMSFRQFYDANSRLFHPTLHESRSHNILNSLERMVVYVGTALGDFPDDMYFHLYRTLPEDWTWQYRRPAGKSFVRPGVPVRASHYRMNNLNFVPTWGGSMSEALRASLYVPEVDWAPRSWGLNHARYIELQKRFGFTVAGKTVWGADPCYLPDGRYAEFGVPGLGMWNLGYVPDLEGHFPVPPYRGEPTRRTTNNPVGREGYGHCVIAPIASLQALPIARNDALGNLAILEHGTPVYDATFGFSSSYVTGTEQAATIHLMNEKARAVRAVTLALASYDGRAELVLGQKVQDLLAQDDFRI